MAADLDLREIRQWIATGAGVVLTVAWIAYCTYSIIEGRRTQRRLEAFGERVTERVDAVRWEAEVHGDDVV
jgi:hypothetical protein